MTPRETLNQYRQTVQEILAIRHQIDRLQPPGMPKGVRTQQYAPSPATNDPASAALQLYDGLERQMTERQARLDRLSPAFHDIADSTPTPLMAVIVYRYYAMAETDAQVAEAAGLSRRRIAQLRKEYTEAL